MLLVANIQDRPHVYAQLNRRGVNSTACHFEPHSRTNETNPRLLCTVLTPPYIHFTNYLTNFDGLNSVA